MDPWLLALALLLLWATTAAVLAPVVARGMRGTSDKVTFGKCAPLSSAGRSAWYIRSSSNDGETETQ